MEINTEVAAELGAVIGGSGISGGTTLRVQTNMGKSETVQRTQSNTVGFHLQDNDAGDSFTVDVKPDPVFGTFVFGLQAATTSCPWEPGTLPRDGTQLTVDSPTQVDVPADGAAIFRLTLGNTGQNDEEREYRLDAITGSNPDGAVVRLNGSSIADNPPIKIPSGSSRDVTLTIERGPLAFDYENLGSLCVRPVMRQLQIRYL
ncbi:hypothetical protein [Rhodohalobacter sp. 8-1]|uniref:hypothetical protein n=1 Tax=Rhodohalobacter sp. 8-1 TaxID=3131972 RepID=UPI0030ECA5CF